MPLNKEALNRTHDCSFTRMVLASNNPQRFICHETKSKQSWQPYSRVTQKLPF